MRRFSYVLEWAGIVVAVSTLILRVPLVLAYFIKSRESSITSLLRGFS